MKHLDVVHRLERIRHSIQRRGGDVTVFSIAPVARPDDLAAVERQIGRVLPQSLRTFFLDVSAGVDVLWSVATPGRDFTGSFNLRLNDVPVDWINWDGWRDAFANPASYDWPAEMNLDVFNALYPLLSTTNSDQLVVFYDDPDDPGEVMYLDHERGEADRTFLATSLERFFAVWVTLGCPGPEFDDLVDFYDFEAQELSLETDAAREWLRYLDKA